MCLKLIIGAAICMALYGIGLLIIWALENIEFKKSDGKTTYHFKRFKK